MSKSAPKPAKSAAWTGKVVDEPRVGFVAQYGSKLQPPAPRPQPLPEPSRSLDKIIDEERRGFVADQRAALGRGPHAPAPKGGRSGTRA